MTCLSVGLLGHNGSPLEDLDGKELFGFCISANSNGAKAAIKPDVWKLVFIIRAAEQIQGFDE